MRTLLTLITLLLLASPALAQAGSPEEPIPITIGVDETGFVDGDEWNVTVGDWYELIVFNYDTELEHELYLVAYGIDMTVPALDEATAVVQFDQAGSFELEDFPSGDVALVHVLELDAVAFEEGAPAAPAEGGSEADGKGAPGAPLAMLGVAVIAVAAVLRRRA